MDIDGVIELNCTPDLSPERQAEARQLLHGVCGPFAEPMLRVCGQAAAARREASILREHQRRLHDGPQLLAVVTDVNNGRIRILVGGAERTLPRPDGMNPRIGQTVMVDAEARAVLGTGDFLVGGQAYAFCERLDERHALVRSLRESAFDEARQMALVSDSVDLHGLQPGDHVLAWLLDHGNLLLITRRIGAFRPALADDFGVTRPVLRSDIVGLEDVLDRVERILLEPPSPEYAVMLGQSARALTGVIFDGIAGSGKSLVADYFLTTVRQRGGKALYRTASHYLSKWVGDGAAHMRGDFAMLDAAYDESGIRPLLVIDEIEAIALDRRHASALHAGYLEVLDTLLSLLTRSAGRMIGISNVGTRYLDAALVRDGRLPIVRFPATVQPDQVVDLVAKSLTGVPLAGDGATAVEWPRDFGETVSDLIFAPDGPLAVLLRARLSDGRELSFGARDLATPAAIADGIVRPMLARNAQRDLRAGRPVPEAVTLDDVRTATLEYFRDRSGTITRDNIRSTLADRIPDDQTVIKVDPVMA